MQEHQVRLAELAWLDADADADDLYFTLLALHQALTAMGDDHPNAPALADTADAALARIDWSEPGSESFYASLAAAAAGLRDGLLGLRQESARTVVGVGHAHIDLAWLWRLRHTREKAAKTVATQLRLMERFPEHRFLQSQVQLYAFLKEDYPDLFAAVAQRIAEGKWDPQAASWVEMDTNLPCGESLVRQLLYAHRFLRDEFGVRPTVLWLPDSFGFTAALPEIARGAGIGVVCTSKLSWKALSRIGWVMV